jgi:hypothetical protein
MASLERLLSVLPPPAHPAEVSRRDDWKAVEAEMGTTLPDDHKEFIGTYGTGRIDGFLWVFNPFSENENLNLITAGKVRLDALRELRDEFGEEVPYKLFPEDGGLLPFAATDNGDVLYWKTSGSPDDWTNVVNESRGPDYEEHQVGVVNFLYGILTREIICSIFPPDFPADSHSFTP